MHGLMRFEELIPLRSFTIETKWPVDVAVVEIQKRVGPFRVLGGGGSEPFVGKKVGERAFKVRAWSGFNQAGRAILLLTVEPGHREGARVVVRMRLNILIAIFMTAWLMLATAGAIVATIAAVRLGMWIALLAWSLPLLGIAFIEIPFVREARESERLLREIFARAPALPEAPPTGDAYR